VVESCGLHVRGHMVKSLDIYVVEIFGRHLMSPPGKKCNWMVTSSTILKMRGST
jgi:hypothetical protein